MNTRRSKALLRIGVAVVAGIAAVAVLAIVPRADVAAQQKKRAGKKAFNLQAMMPDPITHDSAGFTALFDGKSLAGWEGAEGFWRVEDGSIVGETTAEKSLKQNTFLVWRGGKPADFELKLEYRMNSTNSGIQYRSEELLDVGKFVLKGYQADFDSDDRFTGQIYEERGRGFLALRGQVTHIAPGKKARVVGNIGDGDALKSLINSGGWNRLHVIARGNQLVQILNDQLMSVVIDDDTEKRSMEGLIGIQIHVGPPMKLEVRDVLLKNL